MLNGPCTEYIAERIYCWDPAILSMDHPDNRTNVYHCSSYVGFLGHGQPVLGESSFCFGPLGVAWPGMFSGPESKILGQGRPIMGKGHVLFLPRKHI